MGKMFPSGELGDKVRSLRKRKKMNQVTFYRDLYPEKVLEEENIKKKMNAIENGTRKTVDYDFLFRLCDKYEVSLDYLFGFETEYPNYENKAVSNYTGLSSEAVGQLHFWSKYKDKDIPEISSDMSEKQFKEWALEKTRKGEAQWILDITSKLLEKKGVKDKKSGIADLSILYDIYMMSLEPPETITGIPEEIAKGDMEYMQKIYQAEKISTESISFRDSMGEIHSIDIGAVNQQIWKERLLKDIDVFISEIRKGRKAESDSGDDLTTK